MEMKKPSLADETYLTAEQSAQILARAWLDKDFADEFERDPVLAIRNTFPGFKFDKVLYVPFNPGYSEEELMDMLKGDAILFPIPSMVVSAGQDKDSEIKSTIAGRFKAIP